MYRHTTTAASAMVWCGVKGVPHCLHLSTCLGPPCTRWWAACTASCGVPPPAGLLLHAAQGGGPTRKAHTLAPPSSQFACCGAWPALLSVCLACLLGLPGPALRLPCFRSQLRGCCCVGSVALLLGPGTGAVLLRLSRVCPVGAHVVSCGGLEQLQLLNLQPPSSCCGAAARSAP